MKEEQVAQLLAGHRHLTHGQRALMGRALEAHGWQCWGQNRR